jgi:hypothetical protein
MSKATIQMCMSTTGFGPQALRALPQTQQYHARASSHSPTTTYTSVSDTENRSDTEMQGYPNRQVSNNYFAQQPSQRPVPRFDMNLKDLFSDDETDKRSFSRVSNQVNAMRPPPPPIKPDPQQQRPQNLPSTPHPPTTILLRLAKLHLPQPRALSAHLAISTDANAFTVPNIQPLQRVRAKHQFSIPRTRRLFRPRLSRQLSRTRSRCAGRDKYGGFTRRWDSVWHGFWGWHA